jgi:hypothetical protein
LLFLGVFLVDQSFWNGDAIPDSSAGSHKTNSHQNRRENRRENKSAEGPAAQPVEKVKDQPDDTVQMQDKPLAKVRAKSKSFVEDPKPVVETTRINLDTVSKHDYDVDGNMELVETIPYALKKGGFAKAMDVEHISINEVLLIG